jgi:hypothetical protein
MSVPTDRESPGETDHLCGLASQQFVLAGRRVVGLCERADQAPGQAKFALAGWRRLAANREEDWGALFKIARLLYGAADCSLAFFQSLFHRNFTGQRS